MADVNQEVIGCSLCDGEAHLRYEKVTILYKGDIVVANAGFYECDECGVKFTTDALDTATIESVYAAYEAKHGKTT